ncbi:MAG TPA: CcmD family protein [Ignavibacteria bacterium]|nr:CcmD family protein [Ignavibacteria bacterium]
MDSLYSFLETNSIYVVLIITLIIWLGLFMYLSGISKKLKNLERISEKKQDS